MAQAPDHSDDELAAVRANLKEGRLSPEDLRTLERLVERTEAAARQLRAAIVE